MWTLGLLVGLAAACDLGFLKDCVEIGYKKNVCLRESECAGERVRKEIRGIGLQIVVETGQEGLREEIGKAIQCDLEGFELCLGMEDEGILRCFHRLQCIDLVELEMSQREEENGNMVKGNEGDKENQGAEEKGEQRDEEGGRGENGNREESEGNREEGNREESERDREEGNREESERNSEEGNREESEGKSEGDRGEESEDEESGAGGIENQRTDVEDKKEESEKREENSEEGIKMPNLLEHSPENISGNMNFPDPKITEEAELLEEMQKLWKRWEDLQQEAAQKENSISNSGFPADSTTETTAETPDTETHRSSGILKEEFPSSHKEIPENLAKAHFESSTTEPDTSSPSIIESKAEEEFDISREHKQVEVESKPQTTEETVEIITEVVYEEALNTHTSTEPEAKTEEDRVSEAETENLIEKSHSNSEEKTKIESEVRIYASATVTELIEGKFEEEKPASEEKPSEMESELEKEISTEASETVAEDDKTSVETERFEETFKSESAETPKKDPNEWPGDIGIVHSDTPKREEEPQEERESYQVYSFASETKDSQEVKSNLYSFNSENIESESEEGESERSAKETSDEFHYEDSVVARAQSEINVEDIERDSKNEPVHDEDLKFLQSNAIQSEDCEKNCEIMCGKGDNLGECKSNCMTSFCAVGTENETSYLTVIVTGVILFLIVSIIYLFMQNKSMRIAFEQGDYVLGQYSSISN
jgi:hypothetical protein